MPRKSKAVIMCSMNKYLRKKLIRSISAIYTGGKLWKCGY